VHPKNIFVFIAIIILCSGCDGFADEITFTATPDFFTATLPSTLTPQATQTSTQPAPVPVVAEEANASPVEGMTTTQLNVRAGPSTASASLGMIGQFVKVQIIGKDASGSWYQIIYADAEAGKGWVRAEFVQVNAPAEIRLVETTSSSGAAVSGLVIQKINVRDGPSTEYELIGVLNSNDVIFITGKDPGGAWLQIEFASAPDGMGWVTAEFLQTGNIEAVPIIGDAIVDAATPTLAAGSPIAGAASAMQDGDSMQAPLAVTVFSPTGSRALQVSGNVSAPDGDVEDWVQFKTYGKVIEIEVTCSGNALHVELWQNEKPVDGFSPACGDKSFVTVASNSNYFLRISESNMNEYGYTNYILNLEIIR
jgi:uncharacterized protein YraI